MSTKKKRNTPKRHTEPGHTPLHCASQRGHVEVVKALLGARAEPNRANKEGHTPLYYASSQGHVEVVKALLAAGADPNRAYDHGYTALHWTSSQGLDEAVRALLAAKADPNKSSTEGYTPLHFASAQGHVEVTRELITGKAHPSPVDKNGYTPLHYATWASHTDVARELFESDAESPVDKPYDTGRTALHFACSHGNVDLVSALIEAGANPKYSDEQGLDALKYAGDNAALLELLGCPDAAAVAAVARSSLTSVLSPPAPSQQLRPLLRPPIDESDPMAGKAEKKPVPPPPAPNPESMQLLEDLLVALDLSKYAGKFRSEGIDLNEAARMNSEQLFKLGMPLGPRVKLLDAMQRYSVLFHSISCCYRPPPSIEAWPPLCSTVTNGLAAAHDIPATTDAQNGSSSLSGSDSNSNPGSLSSSAEH